ncbi:MAG: helix-turn-helix domain-containing protein [Pseudomonadota bacterium]
MTKIEWSGGLNNFYRKKIVTASLQLAAQACGVEYSEVAAIKRKASVAFARQLSMYLCHIVGDMSLRDVATEFGRDRTTVSHACHAIEDRRECPIFDRQIEHLERDLKKQIRKMIDVAAMKPLRELKSVCRAG